MEHVHFMRPELRMPSVRAKCEKKFQREIQNWMRTRYV